MKLKKRAAAFTVAIFWGGAMFLMGIANLIFFPYGEKFLVLVASIYPGYHYPSGFGGVIIVTLYALIDGLVCGFLLALIYNAFVKE